MKRAAILLGCLGFAAATSEAAAAGPAGVPVTPTFAKDVEPIL